MIHHLRLIFPGLILVLLVGLAWPEQARLPVDPAQAAGDRMGYAYPGQYGELFVVPQADIEVGRPDFVTYRTTAPLEMLVDRYLVAMPALGWSEGEAEVAEPTQAQLVFRKGVRMALVRIDRVEAQASAVVISVYEPGGA